MFKLIVFLSNFFVFFTHKIKQTNQKTKFPNKTHKNTKNKTLIKPNVNQLILRQTIKPKPLFGKLY